MTPAVSIVMPVRDGERYLREAVESALVQTLADLELIVVDDGSTDATPDIVADLARGDDRIVVQRADRVGQANARNAAVALARAELVAFLDADDVACPDRLERQLAFLREHEDVALVGGALTFIDRAGRAFVEDVRYPLTDAEIRSAFPRTTPVLTSAATVRRSAFDEAGGFRGRYVDSEDLDLWLRIADRHRLANLDHTVVRYRIHQGQASVQRLERQSLTALGARISARARAEGRPDPLERVEAIDRQILLELGATAEEMAATLVIQATWLAKMFHAAGDAESAARLLDEASARAGEAGSPDLVAQVRSQRERLDGRRGWRERISSLLPG